MVLLWKMDFMSEHNLGAFSEPKGSEPASLEARYQFSDAQQSYVTAYIQFADTKCAWSFAASAALVAYLLTSSTSSPLLRHDPGLIPFVFGVGSLLLLISSAGFAFVGMAPRLGATRSTDPFFFGTVARHQSSSDFERQIAGLDLASLVSVRLRHNFDISRICVRKYTYVKRSFWAGILGVSCLGLALLLSDGEQGSTKSDVGVCPAERLVR